MQILKVLQYGWKYSKRMYYVKIANCFQSTLISLAVYVCEHAWESCGFDDEASSCRGEAY
jgi:hypothetical protein